MKSQRDAGAKKKVTAETESVKKAHELYLDKSFTVDEICGKLDICLGTFYRWKKLWDAQPAEGKK